LSVKIGGRDMINHTETAALWLLTERTGLAGLRSMPEGMLRVAGLGGWGSGRGI
jgi:hypothetical protein